MRILITGSGGQLGHDSREVLSASFQVFPFDKAKLDITHLTDVETALQKVKPNILLNCAAYTKVDACESERDLALKVNSEAPKILATETEKRGIKLIHISTDYVFDGKKQVPQPYTEEDKTNPLSYYGKTKLMGEQAILESTDNYLIIRTAWIYGIQGHNFLKTILKRALKGDPLRIVNDQFGSLTWTHTLSLQIKRLIDANATGIYHATAEGYCTWHEGAKYFLERMGIEANLLPCTTEEYKTPALRPRNSILNNARLKREGLNEMRPWQKDIDEFVEKFKNRLIEEARGAL